MLSEKVALDKLGLTDVPLSADDVAQMDALPKVTYYRVQFTREMDKKLLLYWNTRNKEAVAKALGVCVRVARRRYRELMEEASGEAN